MPAEDVVIVCESGEGQTSSGNMRLIAGGAQLAGHWGGRLVCLLAGGAADQTAEELSRYVDQVHIADFKGHPYNSTAHLRAARTLVHEIGPGAVLFAHSFIGMDLAPRIAAGLGVSAAANCLELKPDTAGLQVIRPMYRGRLLARVEIKTRPVVLTLQPGSAEPPPARQPGRIVSLVVEPEDDPKVRPLGMIAPDKTGIDITKARILVAGGRGLGERDNFALVENLAAALGGVAACSRPLVDMGWFGTDRQVGMSGNSVKPKLYIACAISGAIEHLQGMRESETIVAINTDAEAPIFEVAQLGILGDALEVLPALTAEARAALGEG